MQTSTTRHASRPVPSFDPFPDGCGGRCGSAPNLLTRHLVFAAPVLGKSCWLCSPIYASC